MPRQIKVEIIGDARRLRGAFREAERSTSGFGRNIARAGVFAATGLAGIGAGAAVAAGTAVKAAATFDKTMRQIATIAKLPASAMQDLRKVALDMGAKTSFSAFQASEAMLELAKGGMTAAQIKAGGLRHT
ncbi:MAG TPA: phage tail tape measure protein, partial [Streptosporangiaceae bacterium]